MIQKYSYITVDDENASHLILDHFLRDISELEKLNQFSDPLEALQFLNHNDCDLIFLDIDMPYLNGFELIQQIKKNIFVIMITAHAQKYALSGYQYLDKGVIDFLEKPIEKIRLEEAIQRFLRISNEQKVKVNISDILGFYSEEMLQVQKKDKWVSIPVSSVKYLAVSGNYVHIYVSKLEYYTKYISLEEILKQLPSECFIQVNRQQVVNLFHIESYNKEIIQIGKLENDDFAIIPISTRKRNFVIEQIERIKKTIQ